MKTKGVLLFGLIVLATAAVAQYRTALPGYRFEFPRDNFAHPDFQTEWWYYTGNVTAEDGHRFGFELTFFREGVHPTDESSSPWNIRDIYLAHLALSDLDGGVFYHTERLNRAGPGIAGIDESKQLIWNGNWTTKWSGENQQLDAIDERFQIRLQLHPEKPPVIHGENGVSQKAEGPGHASHYISFTRLSASGTVTVGNRAFHVSGRSWMDHEFFTHELESNQVGWDWMSIQLTDGTDVMIYQIRRKDGSVDPHSSGTFVDAQGHAIHLSSEDIRMVPGGERWNSPITSAEYPVEWNVSIPRFGLELHEKTRLKSQELAGKSKLSPNYWEGAVELNGQRGTKTVGGVGYLEMTGYDRALRIGPESSGGSISR